MPFFLFPLGLDQDGSLHFQTDAVSLLTTPIEVTIPNVIEITLLPDLLNVDLL